MNHLPSVRSWLTGYLWSLYRNQVSQACIIDQALTQHTKSDLILDHYAVIDLPSPKTGLTSLYQVFSAIGYRVQGRDYLEEKQNEFLWMTEEDALEKPVKKVLPQVVVADFWLDKMPLNIQKLIGKYTKEIKHDYVREIQNLSGKAYLGDRKAAEELIKFLIKYFEKDCAFPTVRDFEEVQEYNELLAWVLAFGRRPNHFALSVHLFKKFESLEMFNIFIKDTLGMCLNEIGGVIKGSKKQGMEQSSTKGDKVLLHLKDGSVFIPDRFMEFVWRYPQKKHKNPQKWDQYFTGFIAQNANRVIESVYQEK